MRLLASFKYLVIMSILWWSLIASATIVPALIGGYTLWTYINVDKRKQPNASFVQDVFKAFFMGRGSVPAWIRTERERRRMTLVWRGFWMPVFIAVPLIAASWIFALALSGSADIALTWAIIALPFVLIYTAYRLAKTPKNGWGGRQPLVRTNAVILHGEVVNGEVIN